jgi:hypothetical protein
LVFLPGALMGLLASPTFRQVLRCVALAIGYLGPFLLLLWFIARFGVNVPFWDQWQLVPLFSKIDAGDATFGDFFAQHNEHRTFFPNIVFSIVAFASGWNNKLEMFLNAVTAAGTYVVILAIARQAKGSALLFHGAAVLCGVLVFSLTQLNNWLWGFQLAWFMTNLCVVVAIACVVVPRGLTSAQRVSLAGIACLVASFTLAHGLLSWLALMPLIAMEGGSLRERALRVGWWAAAFLFVAIVYQIGYIKPKQTPDVFFYLQEPGAAATYLVTLLGNGLAPRMVSPTISGMLLLMAFLAFNAYWLFRIRNSVAQVMVPWLALGWFSLLFALATTVGRAGFGVQQATSSRYVTVVVLLLVAVIQLGSILLSSMRRGVAAVAMTLIGTTFLMMMVLSGAEAIQNARRMSDSRVEGKVCLELLYLLRRSNINRNQSCLNRINWNSKLVVGRSAALSDLGFRHFVSPESVRFVPRPGSIYGQIASQYGRVDPSQRRAGVLEVQGWARLPKRSEQPNAVVLTFDNNRSIVTVAIANHRRPDVDSALGSSTYGNSGWKVDLQPEQIPFGSHTLNAWIYDPASSRFLRLRGKRRIVRAQNDEGGGPGK